MPDPRTDAPQVPDPGASLPWHGVGTALAAAAVGIVTYVGFTGAQLFGMVSSPADEPVALADPPALATYQTPAASEPEAEHDHEHAPAAKAAKKEEAEPSRSAERAPKPSAAPSKDAEPEAKARPSSKPAGKAAATPPTRQEKLEIKHATWADRQLAQMLRAMPTPASWFTGSWVLPTSGYRLTATFGESGRYWSSTHTGLDFAAPTGTPVRSVTGGTVTSTGYAGAYGNRIVLTHPDGTETWYCHLSRINVTTGSQVGTGAVIGAVGATGNVTGPHLHFEVRTSSGSPVDPYDALVQHGLRP